ncbi:MAG TPA: Rieske 2Fe-2S domain-containing protein [Flavitalea sp.]|nr:Rieske 2Fe-2S domain-containing protein [Flavitalea sp.]
MISFHLLSPNPESLPFNAAGIAVVDVQDKKICVTRYRDEWYAFSAKCPHASGPMDEGFVDAAGNVVCPVHRYRFSIKNGRDSNGEGYCLKTYKLELRGQALYVGLQSFNFL